MKSRHAASAKRHPLRDLKGVWFSFSDEQLREYMRAPAAARLRWLEQANRMNHMADSPRTRRIREMFRRGEI